MAIYLVLAGLVLALTGVVVLILAFVRGQPKRSGVLALVVGIVLLLVGGWLAAPNWLTLTVAAESAPAKTANPAPEVLPAADLPAQATSSGLTPVQNIAVIAGRSPNDQEIAQHFEKLASVCPEQGSALADVVVNAHATLKAKTGQEPDMIDLMRQLYDGQEGSAADSGMSCVDTGETVVTLMLNGQ